MSVAEYDLSSFGWDGCVIPADLKDVCRRLPTWKQLKTLRYPKLLQGSHVLFPHAFFRVGTNDPYMPAYTKGTLENDGGYAQIFKGQRAIYKSKTAAHTGSVTLTKTAPFSEFCIKEVRLNITPEEEAASPITRGKTYEEEINAILYEVFLHALICKTLEKEGFASVVPHLYEVVAHTKTGELPKAPTEIASIWINMEFLHGTTLEKYCKRNFLPANGRADVIAKNESILLDILVQLAYYLHVLQDKLRFNHRDMKVNNVYIRHHDPSEKWTRTITVPGGRSWTCSIDIVLIDFGFACISCGAGFLNPRATLVGAGSWFKPEHDCLKYGRDLGQFLYSLHCSFSLQDYVSPALFGAIREAMRAKKGSRTVDLLMGFEANGTPLVHAGGLPRSLRFNDGIYIFLREPDVDIPECTPSKFLQRLAALRP